MAAAHGSEGEVKTISAGAVAPRWLWPLVAAAAVVGLGWGVWPILFPPQATATRTETPAQPPAPAASPPAAPSTTK